MLQVSEHRARPRIGRALATVAAVLLCATALGQPNLAYAGHGGGGGGGFPRRGWGWRGWRRGFPRRRGRVPWRRNGWLPRRRIWWLPWRRIWRISRSLRGYAPWFRRAARRFSARGFHRRPRVRVLRISLWMGLLTRLWLFWL